MSFILDALKKSELERQRQATPGLVESGAARPRQRLPMWAIALCALLAVNLIVLMVVLTRGWMTSPTSAARSGSRAQTATGSAADDAATPIRRRAEANRAKPAEAANGTSGTDAGDAAGEAGDYRQFSPLDGARTDPSAVYAPEVPVTSAAPLGQSTPPASAPPARQPMSGGAAAHTVRRRDPLLNDGDYKAGEEENLPSVNELNLSGAQALPELHLDVHVFATNSAERFVFINMRKYHEGARLQEGPTIERIRRDGVILDYQGLRFLLPRQ